mmetsp:Transcript_24291/g.36388  ORF Transcript_24291/g.36388 Transcript_24291/m.36388 type:complete len:82 (+) Transcript_24291:188-433(+)|eukprot:CAMPEP_0116011750 /NCGR_PEP_ID=MMETSP0321-20121206/4742_1 /TAXON_ID=163516 /ORGANISM="Leptocylindrus danicus var. danicus, Strain B650" /LENGTH=81 /DNA_ID=CAMNT_0003481019 /DNA_START=153 /DNA_END=398 /DNA_ORIENTATION=-
MKKYKPTYFSFIPTPEKPLIIQNTNLARLKLQTDAYSGNGDMDEDDNGARGDGGNDSTSPSYEQESQALPRTHRSNALPTS